MAELPLPSSPAPPSAFNTVVRLVAAAALLVAVWQWSVAKDEAAALAQRVADLQREAAAINDQLQSSRRELRVLQAADVLTQTLIGGADTPEAQARVWSARSAGLVFTVTRLPPLPAGRAYQLWLVVEGRPTSVGVFTLDAEGRAHAVLDPPPLAAPPTGALVTLEPAGGAMQPSGPVYLRTPAGVPPLLSASAR